MNRLDDLLFLLACPVCSNALARTEAGVECVNCHKEYPLTPWGAPILLGPESERLLQETEKAFGESLLANGWHSPRWPLVERLLTPPSATLDVGMPSVARIFRQNVDHNARVLFLGGMRRRDHLYFSGYRTLVLDIAPGPGIDIVGDGHCLPIRDGQLDAIVSQAVFEHVPQPEQILDRAWRALRPGGLIYVSVPFIQPYHFGPLDYRRYTLPELDQVMARGNFEKIAAGIASGPGSSLAWLLRVYISSFSDRPGTRRILEALAGWATFALKYTDYLLVRRRSAELAACAIYYVGRKPIN
jgi:SAM-dependent methyltransferase